MGTLLYPSNTLAQQALDKWWLTNSQITTREFLVWLRYEYPDYDWTFLWCSKFLIKLHLEQSKIDVRHYHKPVVQVTEETDTTWLTWVNPLEVEFVHGVNTFFNHKIDNTRVRIKKYLKDSNHQYGINYIKEDLDQLIEKYLKPTGKYTSDNHKIYTLK